jgi:hypothetical protein
MAKEFHAAIANWANDNGRCRYLFLHLLRHALIDVGC